MDDSTKYSYEYLLKSKDEAIEKFVLYKNEVETKLKKKIKVLRSDRGGEYESPFVDFVLTMRLYIKPQHLIRLNPTE